MAKFLIPLSIVAAYIASGTEQTRRLHLTSTSSRRPLLTVSPASRLRPGGGGSSQESGWKAISQDNNRREGSTFSPRIDMHQPHIADNNNADNPGQSSPALLRRRRRRRSRQRTTQDAAIPARAPRSSLPASSSLANAPNSHVGPVDDSTPAPTAIAARIPLLPVDEPAADATDSQPVTLPTTVLTSTPSLSPLPLLENPLKVFILAGQSNAVGQGSIPHLDKLIRQKCDSGCNEFRNALWNETSKSYKVNHGVFEKYLKFNRGPLSVHDNLIAADANDTEYETFGPDVMLGWTISEVLGETIGIIKTAWGGKSLAVDFRPPSAGKGNYSGVDPSSYGVYYKKMVDEIAVSLEEIHSWAPSYNDDQGYIIAGFVWFQGYNDLVLPDMCHEYGSNLVSLIRDVRTSLNEPELPFVVGELGMHGADERYMPTFAMSRIIKIRSSQFLVTKMNEFLGNTLFVSTSQYAVLDGDRYDSVYHYCGRADTFFYVGEAFGRGMLSLLGYENMTESNECRCDAVDSPTHTYR